MSTILILLVKIRSSASFSSSSWLFVTNCAWRAMEWWATEPWALAGGALLALLAGVWAWQASYWSRRGVPSLPLEPLLGHSRDRMLLRLSAGELFVRLYARLAPHPFGGVFQFLRPTLVVRDPELIKQIMVKDFSHFEERGQFVNERTNPLSAHLFSLDGPRWRKLRVKLTPTFTSGKMRMMFRLMLGCSEQLRDFLRGAARRRDVVEMKDVVARFTTDVIGTCAFGLQFNSLTDPHSEFRRMGKAIFEPTWSLAIRQIIGIFIPQIGNIIKFPPQHVSDFFIRAVKETVDYREKNNVKRNDFMQLLIELRNKAQLLDDYENTELPTTQTQSAELNSTGNGTSKDSDDLELTDSLLAAQAFVFFIAGYETSATTMGFALHELAMNPDVQDKLQAEIDTVLNDYNNEFSYESIQQMSYLDKVVQETLRKYPPLPNHFRRCTVPYTIPGTDVRIDKGTRVFIPILGLHMDPAYFPDPDRFEPERFSEESKAGRPRFAYLPFGEGPRNCIGMRFGQLQTKLGLAVLLHSFRFTPCDKTVRQVEFEPKAVFTASRGGNWLRLTARH